MITQVVHEQQNSAPYGTRYGDPAGLGLALAVAYELHPPTPRAPELAIAPAEVRTTARTTARRNTAARTRRRTVRG
ncbi:hypothetical protein [Streptomyces spongiae]|uniref:Uncharacterized protein n=1 Tax=Streptomyces spongiae TaxID=565072 RepID=A0A5N8XUN8_9ACTN|nr:hypothetical protein [Streptomyces spongiae]MPY62345.1 hypothetical protein [Streptomyces spongiae]